MGAGAEVRTDARWVLRQRWKLRQWLKQRTDGGCFWDGAEVDWSEAGGTEADVATKVKVG